MTLSEHLKGESKRSCAWSINGVFNFLSDELVVVNITGFPLSHFNTRTLNLKKSTNTCKVTLYVCVFQINK